MQQWRARLTACLLPQQLRRRPAQPVLQRRLGRVLRVLLHVDSQVSYPLAQLHDLFPQLSMARSPVAAAADLSRRYHASAARRHMMEARSPIWSARPRLPGDRSHPGCHRAAARARRACAPARRVLGCHAAAVAARGRVGTSSSAARTGPREWPRGPPGSIGPRGRGRAGAEGGSAPAPWGGRAAQGQPPAAAAALTRLRDGDVVEVDVVGAAGCVVAKLELGDRVGAEVLAGQAQVGERRAVE